MLCNPKIAVFLTVVSFLITSSTVLAQTSQDVTLSIIPERSSTSIPGSITFVVIAENGTTQELQQVSFDLVNPGWNLQVAQPITTTIAPSTTVMGVYNLALEQETTSMLVGQLSYMVAGQRHNVVAHTEFSLARQPGLWFNIGENIWNIVFIFIGALVGALSGYLAEVRQISITRQQAARKALGVLIPTLDACIQAVNNNRQPPITLWQEVYFKEGLHSALAEQAEKHQRPAIMQSIARLYIDLDDYHKRNGNVAQGEKDQLMRRMKEARTELGDIERGQ